MCLTTEVIMFIRLYYNLHNVFLAIYSSARPWYVIHTQRLGTYRLGANGKIFKWEPIAKFSKWELRERYSGETDLKESSILECNCMYSLISIISLASSCPIGLPNLHKNLFRTLFTRAPLWIKHVSKCCTQTKRKCIDYV